MLALLLCVIAALAVEVHSFDKLIAHVVESYYMRDQRRAEMAKAAVLPTYCHCNQAFLEDPTGECLRSAQYDVANACFNCPVANASGHFNLCGSLIRLGFGGCTQPGAAAAMSAACLGIGGNTLQSSYRCIASVGTDQSQLTCAPSAPTAPTSTSPAAPSPPTSPLSSPTAQPTNHALSQRLPGLLLFLTSVLFACSL